MRKVVCLCLALLFSGLPFLSVVPASAASIDNKRLVNLINEYRKSRSLEPLKRNKRLEESSRRKAKEMASERYFGHTGPAGKPFYMNIRHVGYRYSHVGEILARGCETETCLFDLWVDSREHRRIILDPGFQEVGCGDWAAGTTDRYLAVCHFGHPNR